MKKKHTVIIVAILVLTLHSCSSNQENDYIENSSPPIADFSFTGDNKLAPANVKFENKSTYANTYLWDFGDGASSIDKNPIHKYSGGKYIVQLTSRGYGGTATVTKTVDIAFPPTPTSAKITKVTVSKIPLPTLFRQNSNTVYGLNLQFFIVNTENYEDQIFSPVYDNILESQLPLSWTGMTPKTINNLSTEYDVSVTKNGGQEIGKVSFKMLDYTVGSNPYPSRIILKQKTKKNSQENIIELILHVTWI